MFRKTEIKQYLATYCVNIIAICYGSTCGWTSFSIPILQEREIIETGTLSVEEASWVTAIMCIGGLIGTILFGFLTNIFGRKTSLCILAFPQIISSVLILCTQNIYYLLVSRFLGGIVGGGTYVVLPLYISEISDDKIRGSLGSKLVMFSNSGILLMFVAGNYLSYEIIPKLAMILPVVFFATIIFLPETPYFLMKSKKESEAESSWRYFHLLKEGSHEMSVELKIELEKLRNHSSFLIANECKVEWKDFTKRAFLISFGLGTLNQLCGCFAMLTYTATIFKEAGTSLSPNMAAIIVGTIQLLGAYISTILVDRTGRKILLITSSLGICLGLSVLGIYSFLKENEFDAESFGWVPIASFSFVILIANFGVLTLPFVVMSEVMPEKIRATASTICLSLLWIISFIVVKFFAKITELLAMHGCMFLFSGFCFLGTIFVYYVVPETKGKSFDEISKILEKK